MRHNTKLYLGVVNVLCIKLSLSDQEEKIQAIYSMPEMMYWAKLEAIIILYHDVSAILVPLLLRLLKWCKKASKLLLQRPLLPSSPGS